MKVEILENGTQAKSLNPFREEPRFKLGTDLLWQQAEESRKTFEIDVSELNKVFDSVAERLGGKVAHINYGLEPGTIHEAELLPNGKIKIKTMENKQIEKLAEEAIAVSNDPLIEKGNVLKRIEWVKGYTAANKGGGMTKEEVLKKVFNLRLEADLKNYLGESLPGFLKAMEEYASQSPLPDANEIGIDWGQMERNFIEQHDADRFDSAMDIFNWFRSRPEFQLRQGDGIAVGFGDWIRKIAEDAFKNGNPATVNKQWVKFEDYWDAFKLSPDYKSLAELSGQRGFRRELSVDEQIEVIKKATKEASVSKEAAIKFLKEAGILDIIKDESTKS